MARTSLEANKFRMVLRSHMRKRESITILPEDIIYSILILLPVDILCNVVRYVCRGWYKLIQDPQFVRTHNLSSSTSTLLMHTKGFDLGVYQLLDAGECEVRLADFKFQLPTRVSVRSSCNGLLLMEDIYRRMYYVGNPITRRILALPKLSSFMSPIGSRCSLSFEDSCRVYKVVVVFDDRRWRSKMRHLECAILTVGVDKAWRVLNLRHLKKKYTNLGFLLNKQSPFVGFICWDSQSDSFALDVKSEIMNPIPVPCVSPKIGHLLPKGNAISFVVTTLDLSMEVWVLKDHKRGEWVKSLCSESEVIRNEWKKFLSHNNLRTCVDPYVFVTPQSWLGNGEKILFSIPTLCRNNSEDRYINYGHFVVYDMSTHAFFLVDVTKHYEDSDFVPFIPSLAWI